MKKSTLLFCLFALIACDKKQVDPFQVPLRGTYDVTHLTQYQDGQLVFERNLPAIINGDILIGHALSIDLSVLKSSQTDAFINYNAVQSWGNYSRSYGRPIANNRISIKATQNLGTFNFYDSNNILLGSSDGANVSFDFTVPDSLGHPIRYVYKAKKSSPNPNTYTLPN